MGSYLFAMMGTIDMNSERWDSIWNGDSIGRTGSLYRGGLQ